MRVVFRILVPSLSTVVSRRSRRLSTLQAPHTLSPLLLPLSFLGSPPRDTIDPARSLPSSLLLLLPSMGETAHSTHLPLSRTPSHFDLLIYCNLSSNTIWLHSQTLPLLWHMQKSIQTHNVDVTLPHSRIVVPLKKSFPSLLNFIGRALLKRTLQSSVKLFHIHSV